MNSRNKSFSVSILRKASEKKVDKIAPFIEKEQDTVFLKFYPAKNSNPVRMREDTFTFSHCDNASFDTCFSL